MTTITFDTHKFVRKLESSGLPTSQAEAIADAFKDASGEAEVATKRDVEHLETRIDKLDMRLTGEMTLIKWMLGLLLAGVASIVIKTFF